MTKEEFIDLYGLYKDGALAHDLNEVIRGELVRYHKWLQKNKYTEIKHSHKECADEYLKSQQK
jgi:hypothetical protein